MKDTVFSREVMWNIKGIGQLSFKNPLVMGILNTTPDSFFSGSRALLQDEVALRIHTMIKEGVDIIDIGGVSTRPDAEDVTEQEEKNRVEFAIDYLHQHFPKQLISLDTTRQSVAEWGNKKGIHIINDVSGGDDDHNMLDYIGENKIPYIMMHKRGNPKTMNNLTKYDAILNDIMQYFVKKVEVLESYQHYDFALDPGLGFAKTTNQNYVLLRNLHYFGEVGYPLLIGLSRKRMIYQLLDIKPEEALNATTAAHMIALINGAKILRVHDVKEAKETVQIYNQYNINNTRIE